MKDRGFESYNSPLDKTAAESESALRLLEQKVPPGALTALTPEHYRLVAAIEQEKVRLQEARRQEQQGETDIELFVRGKKNDNKFIPTLMARANPFQPLNRNAKRVYGRELLGTFLFAGAQVRVERLGWNLSLLDCQVLLSIYELAYGRQSFGREFSVKTSELLERLEWADGGSEYRRLNDSIDRLKETFLNIKVDRAETKVAVIDKLAIGALPLLEVYWVHLKGDPEQQRRYAFRVSHNWAELIQANEYRLLPQQWQQLTPWAQALSIIISLSKDPQQTFLWPSLKERLHYTGRNRDFRRYVNRAVELLQREKILTKKEATEDKLTVWLSPVRRSKKIPKM